MVRPMPARQLWAFLTDLDVEKLLAGIAAREPGLVISQGRYLRGDPRALLEDPAALERRESLPGERRTYLFHRKHSTDIVTNLQPEGPFAGWVQIDEERTDCMVLLRKDPRPASWSRRGSTRTSPTGALPTRRESGPCSPSGPARR